MNSNDKAPATKQDLAELRKETKQDLANLENKLLEAIREGETRLKEELLEAMQKLIFDAETHLLNAFYGFAESSQKHFAELDRADGSIRERLGALENRVIEIEKRLNFPPPPSG